VPVVVLTTSASEGDVVGAANRNVNSYLIKPPELGALRQLIAQVDAYWLGLDHLASHGAR
jgi:CheY-like chemotaxis protein